MTSLSYPKISIVTPCYNSEKYIESTILSVLNQNYPNLEYVIIDGGSKDNTLEIVKKYQNQLTFWISEKDSGMYDALQKGFEKTTGKIMGWIGSDDMYHQNSFFTIAEIFSLSKNIKWLLGASTLFDEKGRTISAEKSRKFTREDFLKGDYQWIQQESCLWHRELWVRAGSNLNTKMKFAGDFELWLRFFRFEELFVTDALIGGFRLRSSNQLSLDNLDEYLAEVKDVISIENLNLKFKTHESKIIRTLDKPISRIHFNRHTQKFVLK
jgi:glycosyltransferase involved in cell wall biosynthesis